MDWTNVLNQLSGAGIERPRGSGDVVPFQRTDIGQGGATGSNQIAGAQTATPGPSGQFAAPAATPGASGAFDPTSFLANLSSFMPLMNQLIAQQNAAAIQSGQRHAQAQPGAQAVARPSSASLGAMAPAGSPAPAGIAPATFNPGSGD